MEPDVPAAVGSRIWTIPNALCALRLGLVPVFLWLVLRGDDVAALLVLIASSATDYLDGVIARRFDQMSRLGQLLDPAADRLFIFAALVGLASRGVVPWWLVAVIVGRDVALAVLGVVLASHRYGPLPVHRLGKVATFCLLYALPLLMVGEAFPAAMAIAAPLGWAFAFWGAFLYWWAGALYGAQTIRLTHRSPGARSVT